ncbi:MAG: hypothetical protein GY804_00760 [Alphaproteobacteria bacterium]|nr:hypothetical protein [Alphaproteobacteria bacterium]
MRKISILLTAVFVCVFSFVGNARADIVNNVFKIQCVPELGYLEISDFHINGELVKKQLNENPEEIYKKYGIKEYFSMLHYSEDKFVYKVDTFTDTCAIDNHKYEMSVTPYYCNRYIEGRRGRHFSINVSIQKDGVKLVDDLTFYGCDDSYKKLRSVSKIEINHFDEGITAHYNDGSFFMTILEQNILHLPMILNRAHLKK